MISNKAMGVTIGIAFVFFLLGMNGVDIGLPAIITSNRLGVLLLLVLNLLLVYNNKVGMKINKIVLTIVCLCLFIALWGLISVLLSPYYTEVALGEVFSWFLISFSLILIFNVFFSSPDNFFEYFLNTIIIFGSLLVIVYFFWAYVNAGYSFDNYVWRNAFSETSNGLSRIMNGLLIVNLINLSVVFGVIRKNKLIYIVSIVSLSVFILMVLISGSRQTLLGLVVGLIFIILYNLIFGNKRSIQNIGISLILLIPITVFLGRQLKLFEWIEERFITSTLNTTSGDQTRLLVLNEALKYAGDNPFFGIGPGVFIVINSIGTATHNGYLNLLVNYGLIPLTVVLSVLIISLLIGSKNIMKIKKINLHIFNVYFFVFLSIFVYSTVSIMFNDLLSEYYVWIMITFLIAMPLKKEFWKKY